VNLPDLEPDERIALAGLVLSIVDADNSKSEAEMEEFRAIAAEVGRREFDEAFRKAKSSLKTVDEAIAYATEKVVRPDARAIIRTVLLDLAAADFISDDERAIIDRISAAWGLPK
jgi:uncharacterized tellurite resistance protein B-like protein